MSYLPKNKKNIRFPILLCSNQNQYIFIQGLVLRKSYIIYCQASMHGFTCYNYHRVDNSSGWLIVPEGMIRPVISASALTFVIRYIFNNIYSS